MDSAPSFALEAQRPLLHLGPMMHWRSDGLAQRPRRLRRNSGVRALMRETRVELDDLIYPLFVHDGGVDPEAIASMPGQFRWPLEGLGDRALELAALGIRGLALFPVLPATLKDAEGSQASDPQSLIYRALRTIRAAVPEMLLIADVALDPYTNHGHDGILTGDGTDVDNDATVEALSRMAVLLARCGADWVAPSDMMDGRIGAIRASLDEAGLTSTAILAYTAKYASAYYGPFREAVGSAQVAGTSALDKGTYQLDPANRLEALREADLDEAEGADLLMVKPAGPYLDIIRELRGRTALPLAAYQVSGEYAQIRAAADRGWLDGRRVRDESLIAIRRAGAGLILTYFAEEIARERAGDAPSADCLPEQDSGSGI